VQERVLVGREHAHLGEREPTDRDHDRKAEDSGRGPAESGRGRGAVTGERNVGKGERQPDGG